MTTVRTLVPDLIAAVKKLVTNVWFGVTSFVDKPTSPFGSSSDHEYQTELKLTGKSKAFQDAVDALAIKSGNDFEELQLTGLMQTALRSKEVGWRDGSLKVVVLTTDAAFHEAGDFSSAGPNDGDAVLDGPGNNGTGEDYPRIAQVANALKAQGVIPIFAVTASQVATYEQLVKDLGFGIVVELSSDSSDIVAAFREGLKSVSETIIENAVGGKFDDKIVGNDANNKLFGGDGDDNLNGKKGNDKLFGENGNDRLDGENGNDLLRGGNGNDNLKGGKGNDRLYGDNGKDNLNGGAGRDKLDGGANNDSLTGGKGPDTFIFKKDFGDDTITDFEDGIDKINMKKTGLSFSDLTIASDGAGGSEITTSEGTITVENVLPGSLDASDFVF